MKIKASSCNVDKRHQLTVLYPMSWAHYISLFGHRSWRSRQNVRETIGEYDHWFHQTCLWMRCLQLSVANIDFKRGQLVDLNYNVSNCSSCVISFINDHLTIWVWKVTAQGTIYPSKACNWNCSKSKEMQLFGTSKILKCMKSRNSGWVFYNIY